MSQQSDPIPTLPDPTPAGGYKGGQQTNEPNNQPNNKQTLVSSVSSGASELPEQYVESDPLITAVSVACRIACPSMKQMDWADDLAREFGQEQTIRALMTAAENGPAHKALKNASDSLRLKRLVKQRADDRADNEDRERRLAEARRDRARQAQAESEAAPTSAGVAPTASGSTQSMADLMGGLPDWYRKQSKPE